MCCSWRSHRAEPGQLSPSPSSFLLPKPPSSERGPGRWPRKCSQKELSSGDLQQVLCLQRRGKSRESSPWMHVVPLGLLLAVQAELRAGIEGRSQPESAGWDYPYLVCMGTEQCGTAAAMRALPSCQTHHNTTVAAGTWCPWSTSGSDAGTYHPQS